MTRFGLPAVVLLLVLCAPAAAQDPDRSQELQKLLDESRELLKTFRGAIDRSEYDLDERKKSLGGDVAASFAFVQSQIRYEPYRGALRGAQGCLRSGAGNAIDKALLLAALLEGPDREVKLAFGELTAEEAKHLIEVNMTMGVSPFFGVLDLPYAIDSPELDAEREAQIAALETHLATRHETLLAALDGALGERAEPTGNPMDAIVADARRHAWVRLVEKGKPAVDLDPCVPWGVPGGTSTAMTSEADAPAEGEWHRVRLRGLVETFAKGEVVTKQLFDKTYKAADTSGSLVVVCHPPGGDALAGLAGSGSPDDRVLSLRLNHQDVASGPFTFSQPGRAKAKSGVGGGFGRMGDRISGGAKSDPPTVAVLVEVTISSPGLPDRTFRRHLLDRWGLAARAAGDVAGLAKLKSSKSALETLDRTVLSFAVETGQVDPFLLQYNLLTTALAEYNGIKIANGKLSYTGGAGDAATRLTCDTYFHYRDRFAEQQLGTAGYAIAPRLVLLELQNTKPKPRMRFDITHERMRRLPYAGDDLHRLRFESGLLASIVEETLIFDPIQPGKTSGRAYGAARGLEASLVARKGPFVVEGDGKLPGGLSKRALSFIKPQLESGLVVVLPRAKSKKKPVTWYAYDRQTGELQGWVETGYHGAGAEYAQSNGNEGKKSTASASRMQNGLKRGARCVINQGPTLVEAAVLGAGVDTAADLAQGASQCVSKAKGKKPRRRGGKPKGTKPKGTKPKGTKPKGTKPKAESPKGKKPKGKDAKPKGGGKNAKHANQKRREAARQKQKEAQERYDELKNKRNKTKEDRKAMEKAKRQRDHWKKQADWNGEHHSQRSKR